MTITLNHILCYLILRIFWNVGGGGEVTRMNTYTKKKAPAAIRFRHVHFDVDSFLMMSARRKR